MILRFMWLYTCHELQKKKQDLDAETDQVKQSLSEENKVQQK